MLHSRLPVCLLLCFGVLPIGCAGPNAAATGTFGTVAGAATGAIIGAASGNPGKGMAIGAVAGGVGGTLIGHEADREARRHDELMQASYERDAAYAEAAAVAQAVTAADLVTLTHNGVGEEVIRGMLFNRGSNVDLSPGGVIYLKQQGVSDGVILAAQQAAAVPASVPVPATRIVPVEHVHERVHVIHPARPIIVTPPRCRRRSRFDDFYRDDCRRPSGLHIQGHWKG